MPTADAWLKPPLYVQNLDELVQLDHDDHDLPRMVPTGEAAPSIDASSATASVTPSQQVTSENIRLTDDQQSARFVYRPPESSEGRYNHYDAVAR